MAHHNDREGGVNDFAAAFSTLPAELQSAAINVVHAAQELDDEVVQAMIRRLRAGIQPGGPFEGKLANFVAMCAQLLEAHYDTRRAVGP
ncbi:hypothetical protein ACQB6R_03870 [Propionibacteriaceae bacterium G1746]|uniref:hypothetical protein n=1 Tax=Aestuariimicrobium sp. G57 TaxID=3418485 RepID=UPI003C1F42F4